MGNSKSEPHTLLKKPVALIFWKIGKTHWSILFNFCCTC